MEMEEIITKVKEYHQSFDIIGARQTYWKNHTEDFIKGTFEDIIKVAKLNAYVEVNEDINNHHSVILAMKNFPTAFYRQNKQERFIQKGGYLMFAQLKNGNILPIVVKPQLNELGEDLEPIYHSTEYEPSVLTLEIIFQEVNNFIQTLMDWQYSRGKELPDITPIGF